MESIELLKMNRALLDVMLRNHIDARDVKYIDLVDDNERMKGQRHKTSYIISYLAAKYGMSERGVYKILNRMHRNVRL